MNCKDSVAGLVASLESDQAMSDEAREHIRTCERCGDLIDSARRFQTLLAGDGIEPPILDPTLAAAELEVQRRRWRRAIAVGAGIVLILAAAVAWMLIAAREVPPLEAILVVSGGVMIGVLMLTPLALIWHFVRRSRNGTPQLYKRLKRGRWISGVCLGIAERADVNVNLVRLVFVLLLFFQMIGFWLYLMLGLAMPVHPDDRQFLWRFRLRRWWQRRTRATDVAA
jgi:phage shock protein PspC (stress-responsive transcriptional regulator)